MEKFLQTAAFPSLAKDFDAANMQPQSQSMAQRMNGPSTSAQGLLVPGNILSIYNRPATHNTLTDRGTFDQSSQGYSTTYSKSFNFGGKEVLLPTVVGGKFLTDQETIDRFKKTGEHLGMFDTPANADAYATALHNSQEAVGNFYGTGKKK